MKKANHAYIFEFKEERDIFKFIHFYKKYFVSYSDSVIKENAAWGDYETAFYMQFGINPRVGWVSHVYKGDGILVSIMMLPEDFELIKNMFDKNRLMKGRFMYTYNDKKFRREIKET